MRVCLTNRAFGSLFSLLLLLHLGGGCEKGRRVLYVRPLPETPTADIVDISWYGGLPPQNQVLVRTLDRFWISNLKHWEPILTKRLERFDGSSFYDGIGRTYWSHGYFWALDDAVNGPVLMRTREGANWQSVSLPLDAFNRDRSPGETMVMDWLRLAVTPQDLYLVAPQNVWQYDEQEQSHWRPIDLPGVELQIDDGSPRFLQAYLPATTQRPYELVALFRNAYRLYRREVNSSYFEHVSDLTTMGSAFDSTPDGAVLFSVLPHSLKRSVDRGETWFPFGEVQFGRITTHSVVDYRLREGAPLTSFLYLGTDDGSIYRSPVDQADWVQVHKGGPEQRPVTSIEVNQDGTRLWAGFLGQGIMVSEDQGLTWKPLKEGLSDSQPFDIQITNPGGFMVADNGGVWRRGDSQSERRSSNAPMVWQRVDHQNITAFSSIADGVTLLGTVSGSLLRLSKKGELLPVTIENDEPLRVPLVSVHPDPSHVATRKESVVLFRQRDNGSEIQAWYRNGRVLRSRDQGETWNPWQWNPDVIEVFAKEDVIDVLLLGETSVVLLTESVDASRNLWVSPDDGLSWTQVEWVFADRMVTIDKVANATLKGSPLDRLLVRSAQSIYYSDNLGSQWNILHGPWEGTSILQHSFNQRQLALLLDSRDGYELMIVADVLADDLNIERYALVWPSFDDIGIPKLLRLGHSEVALLASNELWLANISTVEQTVSRGVLVVSQLLVIIVLAATAFLLLRRQWRPSVIRS